MTSKANKYPPLNSKFQVVGLFNWHSNKKNVSIGIKKEKCPSKDPKNDKNTHR